MNALTIGLNYCLRLPDGRPLGHVRIARVEDAWAEGPFIPALPFEEFRELFEREAKLRHDQVIPLWEEAADAIEALNIQVVGEGESVGQSHLRIFVEAGDAIIGLPLSVPSRPS